MAGMSMEQRGKLGPLTARWKAAQAKNKALGDRRFADLGKLLDRYDDVVGEYKVGSAKGEDVPDAASDQMNNVLSAYIRKNQELDRSSARLEAQFRKTLATMTPGKDKVNVFGILFEQATKKRKALFSAHVSNDRMTSNKLLTLAEVMANAMQGATKQDDLAVEGEKLAAQIRSTLQNYKRQVADQKDKNAGAAIDELLNLL